MPRNSKAQQETNLQVMVREHVFNGKTQGEVAKQLGVRRETVNQNLAKSGMTQNITEVNRQELVTELTQLKEEVKSHRKGDKPLPLPAVDRLIKIAEVIARIQLPTRSENVNINAGVQVIPIEEQYEYSLAFAGLYPDERLEELDRVRARKRTCRVVIESNPIGLSKELSASHDNLESGS
jgi:hypothetical protein